MKTWNKKLLSAAITANMTLLTCSSLPLTHASDIEIYRDATQGTPRILLMLDTSGSMGISSLVLPKNNIYGSPGDVDNTACEIKETYETGGNNSGNILTYQYNAKDTRTQVKKNGVLVANSNSNGLTKDRNAFYKEVIINGVTVPYYVRGCGTAHVDASGKLIESGNNRFDRLSRLKDAILTLLANEEGLANAEMGLGHFSTQTQLKVGGDSSKIQLIDGHSGNILVPVGVLTKDAVGRAHRLKLAQAIAQFQSLDTTTKENGTAADNSSGYSNQRYSSIEPPQNIKKASSGTPTAHAYAEAGAYMMGTQTRSAATNVTNKYVYDGAAYIYNKDASGNTVKQTYFICVGLGTTLTGALGATNNVKQCVNNWPSRTGNKITTSVANNVYKPNGSGGWLKLGDNVSERNNFIDNIMGTMSNDWELYTKLPSGWRYGGWMKVDHMPMDIETITAAPWSPFRNLVTYRTNPFALTETNNSYTENLAGGFSYSAVDTKDGNRYKQGGSANSCDGNGIYFLTDGAPNSTKDTMARSILNDSLRFGGMASGTTVTTPGTYGFSSMPQGQDVLVSPDMQSQLFLGETGGWEYIGEYSKKLFDKTKNPAGMSIRTAVVGFGSSFNELKESSDCEAIKNADPSGYSRDAYNACKWGGDNYGAGGFYFADNVDDIQNSIINFVKKVEVNIDPVVTGTPTLPIDSLNPTRIQPYAYYATLEPNVQKTYQLWLGNLNKYRVLNGELYSSSSLEKLLTESGTLNQIASGFWGGGTLGQLELKHKGTQTQRRVYTNRTIMGDGSNVVATSATSLKPVNLDSFFSSDAGLAYLKNDPKKNYWLNALGYNVGETATVNSLNDLTGVNELRQLGATLHSTPLLLTQEGRVNANLTTSDRKDYLLYGSTQGILHVVDASTGKETFSFIPSEMMERQGQAFLENKLTAGGSSNLFYGIDGTWTAHTQYVTKKDGTLTVGDSGRSSEEEKEEEKDTTGNISTENNLKGKQWVYGGLRMGGKSYYGLDLSDLSAPKLKLHIDPSAKDAKVELQGMGQSWSKPTLGYVNWGGTRKLVMFVGGGYDAEGEVICASDSTKNGKGYECPSYHQTNKKGAGVYMFDAENGDLLWWSSSERPTGYDANIRFTQNTDLKYSVASQINAIDRNGDGMVDHLYFGDLAGQAFRTDLNNSLKVSDPNSVNSSEVIAAKDKFGVRTVTLFSENKDMSTGLKPRFYEMPSVSIHTDSDSGTRFAAVAFSSGNRSSPLTEISQTDGVFVAYDKDVVKPDVLKSGFDIKSQNLTLQNLVLNTGVPFTGSGWRSYFSKTAGSYKGMNELYAVDNMLYVGAYHKDGAGTSGQCGAGVRGDSYLFQYCLPYGKCSFYGADTKEVNKVKIGVGILGTGLGGGYSNVKNQLGLIVNRNKDLNCTEPANKNLPECQLFDNSLRLKQLRWYETQ